MPAEYPFKPPAFVMMTPSGRFETGTKICLSISSYHPESWQPSWSVRSALTALIAFMQTPGNGAVGSLDHSPEVRMQMADEARNTPPRHASADRQQLINGLHQRMLEMEERSRMLYKYQSSNEPTSEVAQPLSAQQSSRHADAPSSTGPETLSRSSERGEEQPLSPMSTPPPSPTTSQNNSTDVSRTAEMTTPLASSEAGPTPVIEPQRAAARSSPDPVTSHLEEPLTQQPAPGPALLLSTSWEDRGLTFLALLLVALLAAVVLRRSLRSLPQSTDGLFSVNPLGEMDLEL